jgi:hypothetical protein
MVYLQCRQVDSDRIVFQTRPRQAALPSDPLEIVGIPFRVRDCPFPEAGLYLMELVYNGVVIGQQDLAVR